MPICNCEGCLDGQTHFDFEETGMTIETILIIDTETTGLHPDKDAELIEIGAVLYNIQHRAVLQSFSTLLPCDENPVENINGINAEVTRLNYAQGITYPTLAAMLYHADAIVAHNAQFDKKFLDTTSLMRDFNSKPWICTKDDFTWHVALFRKRLQDICLALQVPYIEAHRALNDCMLLAQCFNKVPDLVDRMNRTKGGGNSLGFAGSIR